MTRRRREWFDNDTFWEELFPYLFPERRFTDTPEEIEKVLDLAQPEGKSALDLCCGPGRCSIALAQSGFEVTGVDRSEFMLAKARAKARRAKAKIEWVRMDMRDFVRAESYDIALSMFTSFGYFDDKEEDTLVLGNIFAGLRSNGVCLIDIKGKECIAQFLQPTASDVYPDGTRLIQRHEIFDDWTRIRNEWILIRKGKAKSFIFPHTIYSGQELRDRMEQAGFVDVKLYGTLDGDEYGPDSKRLIAVGRKGETKG